MDSPHLKLVKSYLGWSGGRRRTICTRLIGLVDGSGTTTSWWLSLTDRPCGRTALDKNGSASLQATRTCPVSDSTTFDTRTPLTSWLRVSIRKSPASA